MRKRWELAKGQEQPQQMGGMRPPNMPPMGGMRPGPGMNIPNPNMGMGQGPEQGIAGPPPGVMEMLMQMLMGQSKPGSPMGNAVKGAGMVQGGINRLKGNNKPEMNKNPPRMPLPKPQSQMMPPDGGMRNFGGGTGQPQMGGMMPPMQPPPMMGGGMPMQQPQFNPQLLAMLQQGGGRNFV